MGWFGLIKKKKLQINCPPGGWLGHGRVRGNPEGEVVVECVP